MGRLRADTSAGCDDVTADRITGILLSECRLYMPLSFQSSQSPPSGGLDTSGLKQPRHSTAILARERWQKDDLTLPYPSSCSTLPYPPSCSHPPVPQLLLHPPVPPLLLHPPVPPPLAPPSRTPLLAPPSRTPLLAPSVHTFTFIHPSTLSTRPPSILEPPTQVFRPSPARGVCMGAGAVGGRGGGVCARGGHLARRREGGCRLWTGGLHRHSPACRSIQPRLQWTWSFRGIGTRWCILLSFFSLSIFFPFFLLSQLPKFMTLG